ncbi:MAG: alpha amylase C-terminal domain-containing protein [Verrucomicrobiales bacterium]|nr:alpha amylase C-terminal domain-containing protein [Verrucomicrobiales bacterium]
MGAFPVPGQPGTAFRVWAPHADSVAVVGSFNDWDATRHRLKREESGTWFGVVEEAGVGGEYRYSIGYGGREFTRIDPRARKVTNSAGNGVIWHPEPHREDGFEPPLLDALVIYEMHVGSFHVKEEGRPGTFASAAEKLPYLADLGITAIELMPVTEFAGDYSWGYNPANPYAVESGYGGPEGLMEFIAAAHQHGIAVILDVVYNHFGPGDASVWQFDGWSENNLGGIYCYNDGRASTPWGDSRPDYGRGQVRTYLRDNACMWIEEYGADGLRWDATVYIRSCSGRVDGAADELAEGWGLMQWINDEVHAVEPRSILIAEDLRHCEWLVKSTGAGGAGFNAQWDSAFVHPVRSTLAAPDDAARSLDVILAALRMRYDGDAFRRVVYCESHDEVANGKQRMPSEIAPENPNSYHARKRSMLGALLAFTAPGIPMLFQGQEFLEAGWFQDHVPVDWAKAERLRGMVRFYRDLIHLRTNRRGFTAGLMGQHLETHHVDHARRILGYLRQRDGGPGDTTLVILNLSHEAVTDCEVGVPFAGRWRVRLNSDARVYADDFGDHPALDVEAQAAPLDGCTHRINLGVGAYSALVLSLDRGPEQALPR